METPTRRRYVLLGVTIPDGHPATITSNLPPGSVVTVRVGDRRLRYRLTDTALDGGNFAAEPTAYL